MTNKSVVIFFGLLVGLSALSDFAQRTYFRSHPVQPAQTAQTLGSASDNTLQFYPASTRVYVETSDTLVVASSTGRTYLRLDNASGATTTAQMVSCNFGDRAATLYSGKTFFASTSMTYNLDNLYRGAVRCIAPAAGALITVTDF